MKNTETFVQDVIAFNQEILKIEPRPLNLLPSHEATHLSKALEEEMVEFTCADEEADLVGCVDALMDLMYFAVGGLYKMGLTADQIVECQKAVHDANMTKKKGVVAKRDNGTADAIKPIGWVSPEERIKKILGVKIV